MSGEIGEVARVIPQPPSPSFSLHSDPRPSASLAGSYGPVEGIKLLSHTATSAQDHRGRAAFVDYEEMSPAKAAMREMAPFQGRKIRMDYNIKRIGEKVAK